MADELVYQEVDAMINWTCLARTKFKSNYQYFSSSFPGVGMGIPVVDPSHRIFSSSIALSCSEGLRHRFQNEGQNGVVSSLLALVAVRGESSLVLPARSRPYGLPQGQLRATKILPRVACFGALQ